MIQVDFSRNIGRLKNLNGANIGPLCVNGYVDVSSYHRRVRFPTIRLHDCLYYNSEVVDVPCIFPFPQLDTGNPDHYLFARTDRYLQSIVDCGSQIVYRLGVSIGGDPPFQTYPPADFDKWADICIHIIRHYNDGWANGFHHAIPTGKSGTNPITDRECGTPRTTNTSASTFMSPSGSKRPVPTSRSAVRRSTARF